MQFWSSVFALALPHKSCRQTDKHFIKIVKSCSGHSKTCKFQKPEVKNFQDSNTFFLYRIQKKLKRKIKNIEPTYRIFRITEEKLFTVLLNDAQIRQEKPKSKRNRKKLVVKKKIYEIDEIPKTMSQLVFIKRDCSLGNSLT